MDPVNMLFTILVLVLFGAIIYSANIEDVTGQRGIALRMMLYSLLGLVFMYSLFVLQLGIFPVPPEAAEAVELPSISALGALANFALAVAVGLLGVRIIAMPGMRERIRALVGGSGRFNPDSSVHMTAAVLCLVVVSITLSQLVISGGLSGLADAYAAENLGVQDVLFTQLMWSMIALLGVGLFIRRTGGQTVQRLGLRLPNGQDVLFGLGVAVALFGFVLMVSTFWSLTVPEEQIAEQTAASAQLAAAFNTIPIALLISILVAVGEEVFFRGALQPVFGLGLTSVFFTVLHVQYTLTPATLALFVASLGLGWLRQRYSTTAAIIGHFAYNFIQLALAILAGTMLSGT